MRKREGEIRIPSGCAISGIIDRTGERFSGADIVKSMEVMHDRSNGLGGGFAAYGIYPDYKEYYAFHVFYDDRSAERAVEEFLEEHFEIVNLGKMPVKRIPEIVDEPLLWRYFVRPLRVKLRESQLSEDEFVARCAIRINSAFKGAFVASCGKDMGVFKAVGYPEDVGRFYKLDEYEGYCFTGHGRFPTNTPGWWGGAHPFSLLGYTVVHNGEISSYDANRRNIESEGYKCSLLTDTEVITYIIDYLNRKIGLTLKETAGVIAAPFWETIGKMAPEDKSRFEYLRNAFSNFLITGPFSILVGFDGGLMALNDRLKLRSMVVAERGTKTYVSSEEAAIRHIQPTLDSIFSPVGGQPVIIEAGR